MCNYLATAPLAAQADYMQHDTLIWLTSIWKQPAPLGCVTAGVPAGGSPANSRVVGIVEVAEDRAAASFADKSA